MREAYEYFESSLEDIEPDHDFIWAMEYFFRKDWIYEFDTASSHFFSGEYEDQEALIKLYKKDFFKSSFGKRVYQKEKKGLEISTMLSGFVSCFAEEEIDGVPYFVLNRFRGKDFEKLLSNDRVLNPQNALSELVNLAGNVGGLHEKGYIHVDLKPGNLFLTTEGIRVIDVGLVSPQGFFSDNGLCLGTPAYMSPEQAENLPLFPSSDVYSLGLSLYQMLSGILPSFVNGKTVVDVMNWHLYKIPVPLIEVSPRVPAGLNDVVMQCLAKKPSERFEDGSKLSEALSQI